MIYELTKDHFKKINHLLAGLEKHPVINGVMDGNNPGCIFADDPEDIRTALVWAKNEMFFLLGDGDNKEFTSFLESFILTEIKPEALKIGQDNFDLEVYPPENWQSQLAGIFPNVELRQGERVPFVFNKQMFLEKSAFTSVPEGYQLTRISPEVIGMDKESLIEQEILRFWPSLDSFFINGIGYCVLKESEVIGTCISVFASGREHEIGINTYSTAHRGKGLASAMARAYIAACLEHGFTPHWTTEDFRKDSVAIALKNGFEKLPNYTAYYFHF